MTKTNKSSIIVTGLLLVCQVFSLAGCAQSKNTEVAVSQTPTSMATNTPVLSPTPTLTPTVTSTPTPVPTATATLKPSPTPAGFVAMSNAGFSMVYPASWKVVEQSGNQITLTDRSESLFFTAMSQAEDEQTLDEVVSDFVDDMESSGQKVTFTGAGTVELADGVIADRQDLIVGSQGDEQGVRFIYVHQGSRGYYMVMFIRGKDFESRELSLERLYESVRLFTPEPYGLPHSQTLVLLGGYPDEKEIDPATSTGSSADYVGLFYSGLVYFSPELRIAPALADRWEISEDGTVYTFYLRPNLRFSSGAELTAQDVKDSWERASDPSNKSTTARTYLGDIAGVQDMLDGEADEISGVKVIDDLTLQVTLDGPKPYFLEKLTYPTSYVVNVKSIDKQSNRTLNVDASGPYVVKEYIEEEALILERNPEWDLRPVVPNIVFMLSAGGSEISLYEEGTIDMAWLGGEDIVRVSQPSDPLHEEYYSSPSMCTTMIQLNPNRAPSDDVNVRKALAMAIDKEALNEQLAQGTSIIADSILPPAMPGFRVDQEEGLPFDPAAAKELLAASKYGKDLPAIVLSASGYGDYQREDVTALVNMWKTNLGIDVKVEYLDPGIFTSAVRENPGNAILYGWCADYPDPQNFLEVLYESESEFNVAGVSIPEIDEMLANAGTEMDGNKRLLAYQEIEKMLLDQVLAIPLSNDTLALLVKPRFKDFVISPLHGFEVLWLTLEEGSDL